MFPKNNTAPGVQDRGRQEVEAAFTGATISTDYYNAVVGERQPGFVESILMREGACGADAAIRTDALLKLSGLSDKRSLQAQIEVERASALICSKCSHGGGYYLPANRAEIVAFERTLRRRAIGTLRTLKVARRALRVLDGQTQLDEGEVKS